MTDINRFQHQQQILKIQSYYTGKSIKQLAQKRFSSAFSGYQQINLINSKIISFHSKNHSFDTTFLYKKDINNQLVDFKNRIKMYDQMQSLIYIQKNPMSIFSYTKSNSSNNSISNQKSTKQFNGVFKSSNKVQTIQSKNTKRRTFKDFLYNKQDISINIPKSNIIAKNVKQKQRFETKIAQKKDFQHFPQQSILTLPTKYQTLDINVNISPTIQTYNNQIHSFYFEQKQKYFRKKSKKKEFPKKQVLHNDQKSKNNESISRKLFAHCCQNQNDESNNCLTHRSQFKTTIELKRRPSTGVPIRKKNNYKSKIASSSKNSNSTTVSINKIQFPNKDFGINYNKIKIQSHPIKQMQRQISFKEKRYQNSQDQISNKTHTPCYVSIKNSIKKSQFMKNKDKLQIEEFLPWDSKYQDLQLQINNHQNEAEQDR